MSTSLGVDLFRPVSPDEAARLKRAGIRFVGRYYSQDSAKALRAAEARVLSVAGLFIVSVYEDDPTNPQYFSAARGLADAVRAAEQATAAGQPAGSTIYFAVDYDAQAADYPAIAQYASAFRRFVRQQCFVEGAYGSGSVLTLLTSSGLIANAWLAQSTGWSGYQAFLISGQCCIRQGLQTVAAGLVVDPDQSNGDAGGWRIA